MDNVFWVRSARALAPQPPVGPSPYMPLAPPPLHALPPPGPAPHSASYAPLSTRQQAYAFNQPLSFDTSSVTTMKNMFDVRSARVPWAQPSQSSLPRACHLRHRRPHALPPPGPNLAPHRMPSFRLGQQASAFNQPLTFDTSKVATMQQMFHVRSARALWPPSFQSGPPPMQAACRLHPMPFPPPGPRTSPRIACPPFDSAERQLLVRRQQAAHPLRMGGHLGLRLCWLWLELGSGKLHKWLRWLEPPPRASTPPDDCAYHAFSLTAPARLTSPYHRVPESSTSDG